MAAALIGDPAGETGSVKTETVRLAPSTVRIVRGAKASKEEVATHPLNRVRKIVETQPDGRRTSLIVFDYE